MTLLKPLSRIACHVRADHVDPMTGEPDARPVKEISLETGETLLLGRYPEAARAPAPFRGRGQKAWTLGVPARTNVSGLQVGIWFDGERFRAASLGLNAVLAQPWGIAGQPLATWPGEALGELTTLWLPRSESGDDGTSYRWRIAIAQTGAAQSFSHAGSTGLAASPPPTTREQREVIVEKFREFLDFPSRSMAPRTGRIRSLPNEPKSRKERLETVRANLERRLGISGLGLDVDLLAELLRPDGLTPGQLAGDRRLDLAMLHDLDLLERGA